MSRTNSLLERRGQREAGFRLLLRPPSSSGLLPFALEAPLIAPARPSSATAALAGLEAAVECGPRRALHAMSQRQRAKVGIYATSLFTAESLSPRAAQLPDMTEAEEEDEDEDGEAALGMALGPEGRYEGVFVTRCDENVGNTQSAAPASHVAPPPLASSKSHVGLSPRSASGYLQQQRRYKREPILTTPLPAPPPLLVSSSAALAAAAIARGAAPNPVPFAGAATGAASGAAAALADVGEPSPLAAGALAAPPSASLLEALDTPRAAEAALASDLNATQSAVSSAMSIVSSSRSRGSLCLESGLATSAASTAAASGGGRQVRRQASTLGPVAMRVVEEQVREASGGAPSLSSWMDSIVGSTPAPHNAIDPPKPRALPGMARMPTCVTVTACAAASGFRGLR